MAGWNGKRSVNSRVGLFGVYLFAATAFAGCFALSCDSSNSQALPKTDPDSTVALRTVTIAEAIADAKAYEPPAEVVADPTFNPDVFEKLRDEFIRQIEERESNSQSVQRPVLGAPKIEPKNGLGTGNIGRIVSAAPIGDAGRVTDLAYDTGSRLLPG